MGNLLSVGGEGGDATKTPPLRNFGGGGAPGLWTGNDGKFWGANTTG